MDLKTMVRRSISELPHMMLAMFPGFTTISYTARYTELCA